MAQMYPRFFPYPSERERRAEKTFYTECARQLDDTWTVLYEQHWFGTRNGRRREGEADFLLMNPDLGIFVVEVKGGQTVEVIDGTWYTTPHGQKHRTKIKNPFTQAADSKSVLRDFVRDKTACSPHLPEFAHLVVFPGHNQVGDMSAQARRELICDRGDLKDLDRCLRRVAAAFGFKRQISTETIDVLRRALAPSFKLLGSERAELESAIDDLDRLTDEQLRAFSLLRRIPRLRVSGHAGTGKTVLAFHRAKELAAQGLRTLFICRSTELSQHLRNTLTADDDGAQHFPVIESIYEHFSPVTERLRAGRVGFPVTRDQVTDFLLGQPRDSLEDFDGLVLDEAQLLSQMDLELLLLRLRPSAPIYVFGDPAQTLPPMPDTTDNNGSNWLDDLPEGAYTTALSAFEESHEVELTINCRSSRRVTNLANALVGRPRPSIGPRGPRPRLGVSDFLHCGSEIERVFCEWSELYGLEPDSLALLVDWSAFRDDFLCFGNPFSTTEDFVDRIPASGWGISVTERLVIDWLGFVSQGIGWSVVRNAARVGLFKDYLEIPLGERPPMDEIRLRFPNWLKQEVKAAFERDATDTTEEAFHTFWPYSYADYSAFLNTAARNEYLRSLGRPVVVAKPIHSFLGMESDAVIALLPSDAKKERALVHASYAMVSRARLLVATVSNADVARALMRFTGWRGGLGVKEWNRQLSSLVDNDWESLRKFIFR